MLYIGVTDVTSGDPQDGADPQQTRQMLSEEGLLAEDWGGDIPMVEVSAKKNINLDA